MKTKLIIKVLFVFVCVMFASTITVDAAVDIFPLIGEAINNYHISPDITPIVGTAMAGFLVSVPKGSDNSGRPAPKMAELYIWDWNDVDVFAGPATTTSMIMSTDITFKTGYSAIKVYVTQSTIKSSYEITGEDDAKGFIQKLAANIPGNDDDIVDLLHNIVNKNLGIAIKYCDSSKSPIIFGTKCNPMKMSGSGTDDNSGNKNELEFNSSIGANPMIIYKGSDIPTDEGSGSGIGI